MIEQSTLSSLAAFPEQLERFYEAIPAEYRNWSPSSWNGIPSEEFTPIEQICHVRDIELDGYQSRFRRALEEETPTLASLDGYVLSKERRYASAQAPDVFDAIRSARAETVKMLSSLSEEQCERTAVFEGYGAITVRGLTHYLCSHDQQHLAGLQWLLGKIEAERIPK